MWISWFYSCEWKKESLHREPCCNWGSFQWTTCTRCSFEGVRRPTANSRCQNHQETSRIKFQSGFNLSKKVSLVTSLDSHNVLVEQPVVEPKCKMPNDMRVSSAEKWTDLPLITDKVEETKTQASQLASTMFFLHFPKHPNREVCKLTKTTRAPCRNRPDARGDRIHLPHKFVDAITADFQVLNDECESRLQHRYAVVVPRQLFLLDPNLPTEQQNCERDIEKFAKHRAARSETRHYSHKEFSCICSCLWRLVLESRQINSKPIRNQRNCRKNSW